MVEDALQQTPKSWSMDEGWFMLVFLSFYGLGVEEGHVPTLWLLPYIDE